MPLPLCALVCLTLAEPARSADPKAPHPQALPTECEIERRIERLQGVLDEGEAKIRTLRRQLELDTTVLLEDTRNNEIRRVVLELLDDPRFREALYPAHMEAGYENGIYIRTTDETFLLNVTGMMQVRWIASNRQTDNRRLQGRNKQDDVNGFEMQYVLLNFDGYLHGPHLTYFISVIGDTDQSNTWETYYAWLAYEFRKELSLSFGILDLPQGFSNLVADNQQLFVDRALAEEVFNVGTSIGVMASGVLFDRLEYAAGVFNGIGNQTDVPSRDQLDTNFAYAASLIYYLLGDGVGGDETDLSFSKDPLWDVGVNVAHNDDNGDEGTTSFFAIPDRLRRGRGIGGYGEADLTGTEMFQFGAHTAFRCRGLSLTAEWYLRTLDGEDERSAWEQLTGRSDARHYQGGYVQAGYFVVPKHIEVAARLGGIWDADGDNTWEWTVGVNVYPLKSDNVKIQADFTRIDEAPLDSGNANWFQNDEVNMFRVALQVAF